MFCHQMFFIVFASSAMVIAEISHRARRQADTECGFLHQENVPWHVVVYEKTNDPHLPICAASLVSHRLVIGVAHCFWDSMTSKPYPASKYVLEFGKTTSPQSQDLDIQTSDVLEIKMPAYFQGRSNNYQADIAVLVTSTPVEYKPHIRPVCLDFDHEFEKHQLSSGNPGKVTRLLTNQDLISAQPLPATAADVSVLSIESCYKMFPTHFAPYITFDKFCAGDQTASDVLCQGASGNGLAMGANRTVGVKYFLRGVMSTAPTEPGSDSLCVSYATFTQISKHTDFITTLLDQWREGEPRL